MPFLSSRRGTRFDRYEYSSTIFPSFLTWLTFAMRWLVQYSATVVQLVPDSSSPHRKGALFSASVVSSTATWRKTHKTSQIHLQCSVVNKNGAPFYIQVVRSALDIKDRKLVVNYKEWLVVATTVIKPWLLRRLITSRNDHQDLDPGWVIPRPQRMMVGATNPRH